jgi:hypothetical protein
MKKKSATQLQREIDEVLAKPVPAPSISAIQIMETARNQATADEVLAGLAGLDGYLGGRVLPPSPQKPGWRVQAFIEDDGAKDLPHGMRRVTIPGEQRTALGIAPSTQK